MLSKRVIATLIAGSFAAASAGAHSYLSDAAGSISDRGYEAQAGDPMLSEDSSPRYMTVFNPDGTSYTLVADAYTAALEPDVLIAMTESMPEHLTVFDPDGSVTSYDFTTVDVAYVQPLLEAVATGSDESDASGLLALTADMPVLLVEVADPIIVAVVDDSMALSETIGFRTEGAPWSILQQMAAFDNALENTG